MLSNRPDWCISRQRAWGVPIPAVDCTACGEAVLTGALVERAAAVFDEYGADAWYERPLEEFIPPGLACPSCGKGTFERERDILDVWFDSGSSHEAVLPIRPDLTWPADIYLEGSDQHRGWFQSSLLVGLGTRGRPPYREVLTHGFLIDVDGQKMSKSVGNVIAPDEVIRESGAESLRLWVASSDFREELRVGKQILQRVVEAYRKIRNTCRYLLANLYDFDPARDLLAAGELQEVDRYILARYAEVAEEVLDAYDRYDFPLIFQRLNQLTTVELSAFYNDVSKDCLYTFSATSRERRSAQTAMYVMVDGLARLLAPILPVTTEEMWRHLPGSREVSVHLAEFPRRPELLKWRDDALVEKWRRLVEVRDKVNAALEVKRQDKTIGTSLGASVRVRAGGATAELLSSVRDELAMLFIVSQAQLEMAGDADDAIDVSVKKADGEKCPRCWRIVPSTAPDSGLCDRCTRAISEQPDAVTR
jgi:isoleucyl-tRNA synthetase